MAAVPKKVTGCDEPTEKVAVKNDVFPVAPRGKPVPLLMRTQASAPARKSGAMCAIPNALSLLSTFLH